MSLQVWLPLTKDERNLGLCGGTFTTSGITFADGGKIGQKYLSGGTITIPASICKNFFNKTGMSFAFWLYPIGTSSSNAIMGQSSMATGDNRMYTIFQYSTPNNLHLSWQDNTATNNATFLGGSWSNFFPADTWTHCCVTYNGNKAIIYRNGEQYAIVNGTSNRTSFEYNFPINGNAIRKLNDVRIYDHCLSQLEVKELAKGLMLHYPLNRSGLGQENLIKDTDFGGISKKYTVTSGTEGGFTYTPTETIAPNTEYIVSCRIRGNANMNLYKICTGGNEALNWINRSQLSTTEYRSFSIVFTYPSSKTLNQIYICTRYGTANTSVGDWFEIEPYSLKLEKGSIATPWCPNLTDTLATTMGLNSTIEYDCSGYCKNGIRTGTFSWINDTPRYNVSTAFEKGIISIPNSFVTTADPIFSVSLWFKLKSGITYTAYTDLISFSSSSYSNQPFRLELCGTPVGKSIMWFRGPSGQSGGFAVKSDISTDEWYHTVLVSEGNKQYSYYVNGEKLGTYNGSANSWTPTGNVSLGENINGVFYESDVRIYATALSAEDVLELYHTAAHIDNLGNTWVYQYNEI